ncbi:Esterase E4 [Harpegnathos saltator]|uniref:Esterase E4 n=1 Tax=Harpegnathos saltator TaxID=610380 RepID=E2C9F9_HARSA|nr:Esterase E4 [Harpegnathos saltator]
MESLQCQDTSLVTLEVQKLIVRVEQGSLLGINKITSDNVGYTAFQGIPYATPPIGELRFRDPEPPQPWNDILNAAEESYNKCIQLQQTHSSNLCKTACGREDCLYLNIYVPHNSKRKIERRPVMVWIHGDDFISGSCMFQRLQPDYFMDKDVIVVCITYRLGILGFLNIGHEEASGNQGLKDLVAALKWINVNIANFTGDPNNITIFGLFHKAILQSGVALCNWAVRENQPEAFQLASLMGYNFKDPVKIVTFFRELSDDELVIKTAMVTNVKDFKMVVFGPTIDRAAKNPFLPCPIRDLIDYDNDIPVLIGHNSHEFLHFMKRGPSHSDEVKYLFNNFKNKKCPKMTDSYQVMHSLTTMWSNFARTGNPNIETKFMKTIWRPATEDSFQFMVIDHLPTTEYKTGTFQFYPFLEDWY